MQALAAHLFGGALRAARGTPPPASLLAALSGLFADGQPDSGAGSPSPPPVAARAQTRAAQQARADGAGGPALPGPFAGLGAMLASPPTGGGALPTEYEHLPQIHLQLARSDSDPAQATLQAVRFQHGTFRIELQLSQMQARAHARAEQAPSTARGGSHARTLASPLLLVCRAAPSSSRRCWACRAARCRS